jgi:hypothetical protein
MIKIKMTVQEDRERTNSELQEVNGKNIQENENMRGGIMVIMSDLDSNATKMNLLESQVKVLNRIDVSIMMLDKASKDIRIEDRKVMAELVTNVLKSITN